MNYNFHCQIGCKIRGKYMSAKDVQFLFIDDDVDEHYLFKGDLNRYAPDADLQCFDSWATFETYLAESNYKLHKRTVVLLDLNMPEISGYEVIERIRSDRRLDALPIIVYSTSGADADIQKSYQLGANSFVTKPHDRDQAEFVTRVLAEYWSNCAKLPSLS